eukprot:jgi/Psemu1/316640/fgenesh1_kg.3744_\
MRTRMRTLLLVRTLLVGRELLVTGTQMTLLVGTLLVEALLVGTARRDTAAAQWRQW